MMCFYRTKHKYKVNLVFGLWFAMLCVVSTACYGDFYDQVVVQSRWSPDPDLFFTVKVTPPKELGQEYRLEIYDENGNAIFADGFSGGVHGVFHPATIDSPLIVVSSTTTGLLVNGYVYKAGKVAKGLSETSRRFPDFISRYKGGFMLMLEERDEKLGNVIHEYLYFAGVFTGPLNRRAVSDRFFKTHFYQ